jgi:hypothetical protein
MLAGSHIISLGYPDIVDMIQKKQYAKVWLRINEICQLPSVDEMADIPANIKILFGIALILETKLADKGVKFIIPALERTPLEKKASVYQCIDELLFGQLIAEKAHQLIVECASSLIHPDAGITLHPSMGATFLSRLYILRGQAYDKLNQPDLAQLSIQYGHSVMKSKSLASDLALLKKNSSSEKDKKNITQNAVAHAAKDNKQSQENDLYIKYITDLNMAEEYEKKNEFKTAIVLLKNALKHSDSLINKKWKDVEVEQEIKNSFKTGVLFIYSEIASCYKKLGDVGSALSYINTAVDKSLLYENQFTWFFQLNRALLYSKIGKLTKAHSDFIAAKCSPNYLTVIEPLKQEEMDKLIEEIISVLDSSITEMMKKENKESYANVVLFTPIYLKFIEKNPKYNPIQFFYNLYITHYELKQYAEALSAVNEAIKRSDKDGNFYLYRAKVHYTMGYFSNDLDYFKKAKDDLKIAQKLKKSKILFNQIKAKIKGCENEVRIELSKENNKPMLALNKENISTLEDKKSSSEVNQPEKKTIQPKTDNGVRKKPDEIKKYNNRQSKKTSSLNAVIKKKLMSEEKLAERAEKERLKKIKKERSLENQQHEKVVTFSKQIVKDLVEKSIEIAEQKGKKEESTKDNPIESKPKYQADLFSKQIMNHLQNAIAKSDFIDAKNDHTEEEKKAKETAEKSIEIEKQKVEKMAIDPQKKDALSVKEPENQISRIREVNASLGIAPAETLRLFSNLNYFLRQNGASLCIYGKSAIKYFMLFNNLDYPKFKPHDIDWKISSVNPKNLRPIFDHIMNPPYYFQQKPDNKVNVSYKNFFSVFDNFPHDMTINYTSDSKDAKEHNDPISVTRAYLYFADEVDKDSVPRLLLNDENNQLKKAFDSGCFYIFLPKKEHPVTCLFSRTIKYIYAFKGILKPKLISYDGVEVSIERFSWLYFLDRIDAKGNYPKSCYLELSELIKNKFFTSAEAIPIIVAFSAILLFHNKPCSFIAADNMRFILQAFYLRHMERSISFYHVAQCAKKVIETNPFLFQESIALNEALISYAMIALKMEMNALQQSKQSYCEQYQHVGQFKQPTAVRSEQNISSHEVAHYYRGK